MAYPRTPVVSSPPNTRPRRSKSEGHFYPHQGDQEDQSSEQTMGRPRRSLSSEPSTAVSTAAATASSHAAKQRSRSEAFDQWNALSDRENQPSYQIPFYTALIKRNRTKIAEWCYKIVDFYEIDRRVVSIALSNFDRYLASKSNSSSKNCCSGDNNRDAWLIILACLQLAIKVHSNDPVHYRMLGNVRATCCYSAEEVAEKELHICHVLQWYLNPPVPAMYLEVASPLFDEIAHNEAIPTQMIQKIVDLSRFLIELSVYDLDLSAERPSSVANAAISVAMNQYLDASTSAVNMWLELTLKHSPHLTDMCIPRLQSILSVNDERMVHCSSPTNVEGNFE